MLMCVVVISNKPTFDSPALTQSVVDGYTPLATQARLYTPVQNCFAIVHPSGKSTSFYFVFCLISHALSCRYALRSADCMSTT